MYQSRLDAAGAVYVSKGNSTAPGGRTTTLPLIADVAGVWVLFGWLFRFSASAQ